MKIKNIDANYNPGEHAKITVILTKSEANIINKLAKRCGVFAHHPVNEETDLDLSFNKTGPFVTPAETIKKLEEKLTSQEENIQSDKTKSKLTQALSKTFKTNAHRGIFDDYGNAWRFNFSNEDPLGAALMKTLNPLCEARRKLYDKALVNAIFSFASADQTQVLKQRLRPKPGPTLYSLSLYC